MAIFSTVDEVDECDKINKVEKRKELKGKSRLPTEAVVLTALALAA